MVDTNKILTVSYGTFSCTLEGFDDSFGTMKAIAEYFRDLAADDRYFGAEPPTPDAEMLARIAEKEISRRVEAHLEENKIVLRADNGSVLPLAMRDTSQGNAANEPVAEAAPAPEAAPSPEAVPAPVAPETPEAANVDVKKSAPIENIQTASVNIADQMAPIASPVADAIAQTSEAAKAPVEPAESVIQARANDPMPIIDAPSYEGSFFDSVAGNAASDIEDEPAETVASRPPADGDDADSVAAKLRRIRAVVSHNSTASTDPLYSEDEHADDFLSDAHQEIEAALAIDDEAELADNAPTDTSDEDISALLERFNGEDGVAEEEEGIFEPESFESESFEPESFEPESSEDQDEVTSAADILDSSSEQDDYIEVEEVDFFDEVDAEDNVAQEAQDEDAAPLRARIIKMKRVDFEAAVATGGIEEELSDEEPTSLSHDEEVELLRELAAVEAELEDTDVAEVDLMLDDEEDEDILAALAAERAEAEAEFEDNDDEEDDEFEDEIGLVEDDDNVDVDDNIETNIFGADEDDRAEQLGEDNPPFEDNAETEMGRIFAEADSQLDEETGKGRRNAIAHLRAAVAAAKAEEGAGGQLKGGGPDKEAYRDDLANVVRPRRPEAGKAQTRRPDAMRPAPLKLVAEQRVDLDDVSPAVEPVRPRRVAMTPAAVPEEVAADSDFAQYAETVGAGSLPELLEAAAAYLSFVEGREQFSRPQLMTRVRQVEKDDFSREDGLRSFGQLLREGKIEKISGGRFKASESISYRPDARYAGE